MKVLVLSGVMVVGLLSLSGLSLAQTNNGTLWYDNAWYSSTGGPGEIQELADRGCGRVILNLAYNHYTSAAMSAYLQRAYALGIEVIPELNPREPVGGWSELSDMINYYQQNFPGVVKGWYLFDEPAGPADLTLSETQTAYNTVKSVSSLPIYAGFCTADLDAGNPYTYRNAYDIMLYDKYPFGIDNPEYSNLEDKWFTILGVPIYRTYEGWKSRVDRAYSQSQQAGKPFYTILQAFGDNSIHSGSSRLPTYNELRFTAYYPLIKHPGSDVSFFSEMYREASYALPGQPYSGDGEAWAGDVAEPIMGELNCYQNAIDNGALSSAVSENGAEILADVFLDPDTGKHYLLTINCGDESENATFTITLPGDWTHLVPYGGGTPIPIIGNQFSLSYSEYEVLNFELVPEPGMLLMMAVGGLHLLQKR